MTVKNKHGVTGRK